MLWDLKPEGVTGSKIEKICDVCQITLNKNAVPGDVSALSPGGVRIGAPAMTTRGLKEKDFEAVADMLHEAVQLAKTIQASAPDKKLVTFSKLLDGHAGVDALRKKVKAFAASYGMPGPSASTTPSPEVWTYTIGPRPVTGRAPPYAFPLDIVVGPSPSFVSVVRREGDRTSVCYSASPFSLAACKTLAGL